MQIAQVIAIVITGLLAVISMAASASSMMDAAHLVDPAEAAKERALARKGLRYSLLYLALCGLSVYFYFVNK